MSLWVSRDCMSSKSQDFLETAQNHSKTIYPEAQLKNHTPPTPDHKNYNPLPQPH